MSETVSSRRKQPKPSRLTETMNETTEMASLNAARVIVKASDVAAQSNGSCGVGHLAGTILGPFQVRGPVDQPDDIVGGEVSHTFFFIPENFNLEIFS